MDSRNGSTSWLQRSLSIPYNRAERLMIRLEREEIVGPPTALGARPVI